MLEVKDLTKVYGAGASAIEVLGGIDLTVQNDEFLCVVGPSGAGKTTLLRCTCGLTLPTAGQVTFKGVPVTTPPEGVALVFQEYGRSLMPWMTVRGNVQLPLVNRKRKKERDHLVTTAVESVGLTKFIDRYPWELSGGMQQRVAIARALAYEPELLIMDEPFASVDAQTRIDLEDLILQVRKQYRMNVLLVTHDIDEAVYLGDRVIVLSHRPSIVTEVVKIPLGSDRDQVTTKGDPRFSNLRGHILSLIRRPEGMAKESQTSSQVVLRRADESVRIITPQFRAQSSKQGVIDVDREQTGSFGRSHHGLPAGNSASSSSGEGSFDGEGSERTYKGTRGRS